MRYIVTFAVFEDDVSDEDFDNITSSWYIDNEKKIKGMQTNELKDEKAYILAKRAFEKAMK